MSRNGRRLARAALFWALTWANAVAAQQSTPSDTPATGTNSSDVPVLRTFTLEKPPDIVAAERNLHVTQEVPVNTPRENDTLRTTVGLGYVQGADWGNEILATGGFKGLQVQANVLITGGEKGFLFDNGTVSLFDPDRHWHAEAGDVFSHLRGVSRGGRFSWDAARGRRPAIAIYGPRPGTLQRPTVVSYRDQLVAGQQTLVDAEVASDKSYILRNRLAGKRVEFEASYRSNPKPVSSQDVSFFANVLTWRGITLSGGVFRSVEGRQPSDWRTASIRVPFSRLFSLTLERAFAATNQTSTSTTAAMASVAAGHLTLFHRYQIGSYDQLQGPFMSIERQQTQSVANYTPSTWVNLSLQLATQRTETGVVQDWEELQTTVTPTRSTTLRFATSVPDFLNEERFRGYIRQELPARFAVQAEYGRLSAFQNVPVGIDQTRFKLMLYRTWGVPTPARGAEVRGRVLDETGRPVSGARVKLGPYSVATDPGGGYVFKNVPKGEYELALDAQFLPADYAWDGRRIGLTLNFSSRIDADLLVTALNAVHGRVYHDRNGNGRFDAGEEVAGAVVAFRDRATATDQLKDRVTATDQHGGYSFYNVWPGTYVVSLVRDKLPADFEPAGPSGFTVEVRDGGPATGVDFKVVPRKKPIIWKDPRR